jgi:hypothetical protein
MVKPEKVWEEFAKKEDENYSFRVYLKGHADSEELDEQFRRLHEELFTTYDCSRCRNCCRMYAPRFEEEEALKAAAYLGMTEEAFIDSYRAGIPEGSARYRSCLFLEKDGACRIEACRPAVCRDFPYTSKPGRMGSLYSILDAAKVCPVVFEILERLKAEYRFPRRRR